jgi:predicted transcriptional regulator with HTH domain
MLNPKYLVVLFKNKVRKKIIKKFSNYKNSLDFFETQVKNSDGVIFERILENTKQVTFQLGLIELGENNHEPFYFNDEYGRNIKIVFEDEGYNLIKLKPHKVEDKIFDIQQNKKIFVSELISKYLKGSEIKMVFSLNNKIVIQKDDDFKMFSLKNEEESERLVDCLSNHFFKNKRTDLIVVPCSSKAQKKYLFNLLVDHGVDKKILYRKYTTYPRVDCQAYPRDES